MTEGTVLQANCCRLGSLAPTMTAEGAQIQAAKPVSQNLIHQREHDIPFSDVFAQVLIPSFPTSELIFANGKNMFCLSAHRGFSRIAAHGGTSPLFGATIPTAVITIFSATVTIPASQPHHDTQALPHTYLIDTLREFFPESVTISCTTSGLRKIAPHSYAAFTCQSFLLHNAVLP